MATFVATSTKVHVGQLDLTANTEQVSIGDLTVTPVPFTNMASGGFVENKPGLKTGEFSLIGFADFTVGAFDDQFGVANLGTQFPISVDPCPTGTSTAGDVAYFSRGWLGRNAPFQGQMGDAARANLSFTYDTVILRGLVAHPSAARTATGNGTACALVGPSATQRLYCGLHVFAYSGLTSLTVKVQSDDGAGFGTPTDRLTMAANTAVGSEFKSTAGGWSSETHHRIVYTIVGTGSVTFAAYLAVY